MFEDYYFDDPDMQQAPAATGYYTNPARSAAVAPSTVRAEPIMGIGSPAVAATFDPSTFDYSSLYGLGLGGLNFSGIGGGMVAGISDPNIQYITAPVSNKGNPTGKISGNVFAITTNQPVRLVDLNTKTIVFEGVGPEAARKATEIGQSITDAKGRKASYDIQTADTAGKYVTVANEKRNKSTLEFLESTVLDIALPIIMNAVIPGSGFLATMAGNALGAVASGVIQGKGIGNIATSALIAGAVGGFTQQTGLDKAIGGALNDLGGNLTKKAVEEVGEEIVVRGLGQLAQNAGGAVANTLINAGLSEVTGFKTPAEKFAGEPADIVVSANRISDAAAGAGSGIVGSTANAVINQPKTAEQVIEEETGDIVALADTAPSAPVPGIGSSVANAVINQPKTAEKIIEAETGDIVALADKTPSVPVTVPGIGTPGVVDPVTGDIVVNKPKPEPTPNDSVIGGLGPPTNLLPDTFFDPPPKDPPKITDIIKDVAAVVGAVAPIIPLIPGGGGGGGTLPPDTTGITFPTSPPSPPTPGIGIGGRYPYTPTTYGRVGGDQETEYMFFTRDPATGAPVAPATAPATAVAPSTVQAPVAGIGAPAPPPPPPPPPPPAASSTRVPTVILTPEGYKFNPAYTADIAMQQYRAELPNNNYYSPQERQQIMSSIENAYAQPGATGEQISNAYQNASASATQTRNLQPPPPPPPPPAAAVPMKDGGEVDDSDDMVKHLVDYHKNGGHYGPGQVKGIGSGQEDKIPAYLSDGEYVWSAQDVSDLGDGSNREGVRRLDKMRQMVRSQAGRKDVKKIAKPQKGIDTMLKAVGGMA